MFVYEGVSAPPLCLLELDRYTLNLTDHEFNESNTPTADVGSLGDPVFIRLQVLVCAFAILFHNSG